MAAQGNRPASGCRAEGRDLGGLLSSPMFIHGRDEPYRPEFVVWMEFVVWLPDHHVVGHAVVMPEDTEGAVARTLRRALTQPAAGSPRQPDVIRVSDAAIAAEVRAEVAGTIPVKVAPTPELDEFLKHMQAAMPEVEGGEASYFAGGHVSPAAVEKLFTAAFSLFAIKPWRVADDTQVLRMDIPALGVDGACLSIIGQLDESRGVLIFTSLDDFEQFLKATEPDANSPKSLSRVISTCPCAAAVNRIWSSPGSVDQSPTQSTS